jgi:hypothetical protein
MSLFDLSTSSAILKFWIETEAKTDDAGELTGEINTTIDDLLKELEGSIEAKVENYCWLIREIEGRAAIRLLESKRIKALATTNENLVKSLKERLKFFFESQAIQKLECKTFKVSIANNGGVQPLQVDLPADQLPVQFQKVTIEPDNASIRKALEMGTEIEGVKLLQRGTSLRIK